MRFMDWKMVRMMIFSELYSTYYQTVVAILKAATDHPVEQKEMRHIIENHAFGESVLHIMPAIQQQRWQLILPDGRTPLRKEPTTPLTLLEKRWLKAIANDPRMRLFGDNIFDFPDVEPLFLPEDILVFDHYTDGDDYADETYIQHFRLILDAIKERYPLKITLQNRRGNPLEMRVIPHCLEYSEKDDKFRLIASSDRYGSTINLGRIISCEKCQDFVTENLTKKTDHRRKVVFELVDRRKTLERVLLHFAHYEKEAEKLDEKHYRITVVYDKEDETEMVIRILSFGPMIKVTAPQHFVDLIKQRLIRQKSCGL